MSLLSSKTLETLGSSDPLYLGALTAMPCNKINDLGHAMFSDAQKHLRLYLRVPYSRTWLHGHGYKHRTLQCAHEKVATLTIVLYSRSPGAGGTDSSTFGTSQLRNYSPHPPPPLFGHRTAPVLLPPNLQPPLFMGA